LTPKMEEMTMAENSREDGPNPLIGAPIRPTSLGELMAWHAYQGTLGSLLIDIGHYYYNPAPSDRDTGRER
jgi:hypothetical protein